MMRKFGLIGYSLEHSFSPTYFANKFERENILDSEYLRYELNDIAEIKTLFRKNLSGLNVTIPFKETVIPYLDKLDESARSVNAVNTIKFIGEEAIGYNTDVYGFEKSFKEFVNQDYKGSALILGTGGSSKAVNFVLQKLGIQTRFISRSKGDLLYQDLDDLIMSECSVIVNTTPVGMFPNIEECPNIPYHFLSPKHFVMDLIYNPEKTLFLKRAEKMNSNIKNGMDMLAFQAERSWDIWNQQ